MALADEGGKLPKQNCEFRFGQADRANEISPRFKGPNTSCSLCMGDIDRLGDQTLDYSSDRQRPYSAAMEGPDLPDRAGRAIRSYVNAMFMGAAAKVWNPWAFWAGLIAAALIIPVFWFRHSIQDGGNFPEHMLDDLGMKQSDLAVRKAGMLPYLTLAAGLLVVLVSNWPFVI
jgi:hypothetical protein